MGDEALLLQTLDWAVQMLVQVDVVASRDGSWPERVTPADQLQYIKELRIILAYLRAVRDRVEIYSASADPRTRHFFNVRLAAVPRRFIGGLAHYGQ